MRVSYQIAVPYVVIIWQYQHDILRYTPTRSIFRDAGRIATKRRRSLRRMPPPGWYRSVGITEEKCYEQWERKKTREIWQKKEGAEKTARRKRDGEKERKEKGNALTSDSRLRIVLYRSFCILRVYILTFLGVKFHSKSAMTTEPLEFERFSTLNRRADIFPRN